MLYAIRTGTSLAGSGVTDRTVYATSRSSSPPDPAGEMRRHNTVADTEIRFDTGVPLPGEIPRHMDKHVCDIHRGLLRRLEGC
jgi:hypothetical protein